MSETGFQFRFQRVLDVREGQRQSVQIELARAAAEQQDAAARLKRWTETKAETLRGLAAARRAGNLDDAARHSSYLEHVRTRLAQCREQHRLARQKADQLRDALEQAMQACKVLQTYRDRLESRHLAERERAEERVIDLHSMHSHTQSKRAQ